MQKKIKIEYPMFLNVGNLCNLTCSGCLVLSPYNFLGVQDINLNRQRYVKWAEILDLQEIVFGGGEPFLNPHLADWVDLFTTLWNNIDIELCTNGTRLKQSGDFIRNFLNRKKNILRVSVHDKTEYTKMKTNLENILTSFDYYSDEILPLDNKIDPSVPSKPISLSGELNYYERGSNRVLAKIAIEDKMFQPYYTKVENNMVFLEMNGDQEESHKNCPFKSVYAFQEGFIYKCPLTMNYPETKKQNIRFEDDAVKILEKYQPCDPYDTYENILYFFENIGRSIPQCSLCAYDKKNDPFVLSQDVTLDKNRKKVFTLNKI